MAEGHCRERCVLEDLMLARPNNGQLQEAVEDSGSADHWLELDLHKNEADGPGPGPGPGPVARTLHPILFGMPTQLSMSSMSVKYG
jgi:hypothetical protein